MDIYTGSVDDHFAKALGETWYKIKAEKEGSRSPERSTTSRSNSSSPASRPRSTSRSPPLQTTLHHTWDVETPLSCHVLFCWQFFAPKVCCLNILCELYFICALLLGSFSDPLASWRSSLRRVHVWVFLLLKLPVCWPWQCVDLSVQLCVEEAEMAASSGHCDWCVSNLSETINVFLYGKLLFSFPAKHLQVFVKHLFGWMIFVRWFSRHRRFPTNRTGMLQTNKHVLFRPPFQAQIFAHKEMQSQEDCRSFPGCFVSWMTRKQNWKEILSMLRKRQNCICFSHDLMFEGERHDLNKYRNLWVKRLPITECFCAICFSLLQYQQFLYFHRCTLEMALSSLVTRADLVFVCEITIFFFFFSIQILQTRECNEKFANSLGTWKCSFSSCIHQMRIIWTVVCFLFFFLEEGQFSLRDCQIWQNLLAFPLTQTIVPDAVARITQAQTQIFCAHFRGWVFWIFERSLEFCNVQN